MKHSFMKRHLIIAIALVVLVGVFPGGATEKEDFKTLKEKASYVIGTQVMANLKSRGAGDLDLEAMVRGISEVLKGEACAFSSQEQNAILSEWTLARSAQKKAAQSAEADRKWQARKKMMASERPQAIKALGPENAWKIDVPKPEMMTFDKDMDYFWILETNKGTIKIKLMPDVAPMHVTSTIYLTKKTFYDGLEFHRVIPGFMAQGGRVAKTARYEWGPDYNYSGEFSDKVRHNKPYLLSMANAGPDTDGSQFFLTFRPTPHLDGKHTIFGEITDGKDVMKKLEAAGSQSGKTKEKLWIKKATIETKPRQ